LEASVGESNDFVVRPRGLIRHKFTVLFLEVENRSHRTLVLDRACYCGNFSPVTPDEIGPGEKVLARTGWAGTQRIHRWCRRPTIFVLGRDREGHEKFVSEAQFDLKLGTVEVRRLGHIPSGLWLQRQMSRPELGFLALGCLGLMLATQSYAAAGGFLAFLGFSFGSEAYRLNRLGSGRWSVAVAALSVVLLASGIPLFLHFR
jgi:hypothetical protein